MAAYYIMTNYGPMRITGLKKGSDDSLGEILKDAPQDMDTFSEVSKKYQDLLKRVEKVESMGVNQDLSNSVEELPTPSSDSLNQIYVDGNKNVFITVKINFDDGTNYADPEIDLSLNVGGNAYESTTFLICLKNDYYLIPSTVSGSTISANTYYEIISVSGYVKKA